MKKLFAIIIALVLVATLPVMAFAAEEETIPSPTDVPVYAVKFVSYEFDTPTEIPVEAVAEGEMVTLTAPESSDGEFVGFVLEGEYEIVSGSEYIIETAEGAESLGIPGGCSIVIIPKSDISVHAYYTSVEEEPTEPPVDDDEDGDSPQTGDDMLLLWIAVAVILGVTGCAFAAKKLSAKKEN